MCGPGEGGGFERAREGAGAAAAEAEAGLSPPLGRERAFDRRRGGRGQQPHSCLVPHLHAGAGGEHQVGVADPEAAVPRLRGGAAGSPRREEGGEREERGGWRAVFTHVPPIGARPGPTKEKGGMAAIAEGAGRLIRRRPTPSPTRPPSSQRPLRTWRHVLRLRTVNTVSLSLYGTVPGFPPPTGTVWTCNRYSEVHGRAARDRAMRGKAKRGSGAPARARSERRGAWAPQPASRTSPCEAYTQRWLPRAPATVKLLYRSDGPAFRLVVAN